VKSRGNSKTVFPLEKIKHVGVSLQQRSQPTTFKKKKRGYKMARGVKAKDGK
jgi:hypothetical protein